MQRHVLDTADVAEYHASLAEAVAGVSASYTRGRDDGGRGGAAAADGTVCFVGIGLPSVAANLARRTHAPGCVLVYESGTIGAKPVELPLSIGDGELAETADAVVSVPEMFAYWLQGGRIDVGFLGAAQIDRHGNLNSTVIGDYDAPDRAPARRRRRAGDRDRRARRLRDAPPLAARVRASASTSRRASATTVARRRHRPRHPRAGATAS